MSPEEPTPPEIVPPGKPYIDPPGPAEPPIIPPGKPYIDPPAPGEPGITPQEPPKPFIVETVRAVRLEHPRLREVPKSSAE